MFKRILGVILTLCVMAVIVMAVLEWRSSPRYSPGAAAVEAHEAAVPDSLIAPVLGED